MILDEGSATDIDAVLMAARRVNELAGDVDARPQGDIGRQFVEWIRSDNSAAILFSETARREFKVLAASPFWRASARDRRRFRWSRRDLEAAQKLGLRVN